MRISNVLAGFSLGEADLLRKAMGKKNPRSWRRCAASSSRAVRLGHPEKKAAHLFELMEHFAGYGLQQVALDGVAYLAYQTANLKANYPWLRLGAADNRSRRTPKARAVSG